MADLNTSNSLVRRSADDVALMPPPPVKRIKRPPKVLDEDDYTASLSDIIARDYFPGLRETQAQQEYLTALDSKNQAWIAEAGQRLRESMTTQEMKGRSERDRRFDHSGGDTPNVPRAVDTPRGYDGSQTPATVADSQTEEIKQSKRDLETSDFSLASFQSTYTSEDNASFNTLLDKQNQKRREKHAYMWTEDQRIPSARQIAYREQEQKLLKQKAEYEANDKAIIPIIIGATDQRPARPDAWKIKKPDNTFMFFPSSVDEDGLATAQDRKEAMSKAGRREVVLENTRFPPLHYVDDEPVGPIPPSPSLNTDIIARRDAARAAGGGFEGDSEYPGGETPRVNGYAFVDEDEPSAAGSRHTRDEGPSYRDLLAGQVGDSTPNPFVVSSVRKREVLHHRMVESTNRKKRDKDRDTVKGLVGSATPVPGKSAASMTPAARKLMEKLGRTPVNVRGERMSSTEMWTPRETLRRGVRAVK